MASVYAVGMLRGRRDRYHRLGFLIPFSVAAVATPIQMGVGDSLARWVYNNQPIKFAAIELVPETSSDVPETLLGHLNSDGTVSGGIPIPGLASWLSDPSTGSSTVVQGLDTVPADQRPTLRQVNTVHLAWDIMVGLGTLLFLLSAWYWLCWIFRRDMPKSRWFLRVAACAGVAAVITMEAGWVVSEVGRQPWIVYNLMTVEDAATANTGVWITFVVVAALYIGLGITTVLILRKMSKRFRERTLAEHDVPYGRAARLRSARPRGGDRCHEHGRRRAAASSPSRRTPSSAAPTSAPGSGTSWPAAPQRGDRPREVIDHSIGPVWEANHVWLIFCFVVLWTGFPEAYASITLTLFIPLTLAALGVVLRGSSFAFRKTVFTHPRPSQLRRRLRHLLGARPVLLRGHRRRRRLGPRARRWAGRRSLDELDEPDVGARWRARRRRRRLPRRRLPRLGCPRGSVIRRWRSTSAGGPSVPRSSPAWSALVGIFVLRSDARYLFDELTTRALPLVIVSVACGTASLVLLVRDADHGARAAGHGRRGEHRRRLGASPSGRTSCPRASRWPMPPHRRAPWRRSSSPPSAPCSSCSPDSSCSTSSTSGACSPTRAPRRTSRESPSADDAPVHEITPR